MPNRAGLTGGRSSPVYDHSGKSFDLIFGGEFKELEVVKVCY